VNLRVKGYQRDKAILETIEKHRTLDTDQIRVLLFNDIKTGQRKAQQRLLTLYKNKRLMRYTANGTYTYYREEQKLLKHTVMVNWIRLWFERCQPSWRIFKTWAYEQTYPMLRCDGFAYTVNVGTKENEFWFVEADRGTNRFDKVEKYCQLFEEGGYEDRWWVELASRFPKILTVTNSPARMERIKEIIQHDNTTGPKGLRFKVMLLDDIKREVLATCKH